jgi:uncharacterized membrane protein
VTHRFTDESAILPVMQQQLRDWHDRGLIDTATLERLIADLDQTRPPAGSSGQSRFNLGVWILFSLGTVALAAAIAVWFAREWGEWGKATRVVLAPGVPLLLGLTAVWLFRPGRWFFPAMGRIFLTLAAVATYSATALLAAMYDLNPRHATMTLLQAVLFIALAFVAQSALLLWAGLALLVIGYGMEVDNAWMLEWQQRPVAFVGLGLAMVIVALVSRHRDRRLGENATVAGALVLFVSLMVLSFDLSARPTAVTVQMWVVLAVPYLVAVGVIAFVWLRSEQSFESHALIPLLSLLLLFALASAWPERFGQGSWVDSTLFTLATLAGAYVGVSARSPALINVSVIFFAVDVLRRYTDWFWEELPGHLFFGLMGILLVGGGLALDQVRRRLLRHAEVSP